MLSVFVSGLDIRLSWSKYKIMINKLAFRNAMFFASLLLSFFSCFSVVSLSEASLEQNKNKTLDKLQNAPEHIKTLYAKIYSKDNL